MPRSLYLDTARLGLMGREAQRANRDFARLCGDEGASQRVDTLLRMGVEAWPDRYRRRYPGLEDWRGIAALKASLRRLTCSAPHTGVLISHRSAQLVKLAGRALFRRCQRVLHTDLDWPG